MGCPIPSIQEFQKRWSAAKKEMEHKGFDVLLVYSNDRAVHGPGHVRYFSNFPAHFEDVAVLFGREGDPILVTGPECREYAQNVSFVKDIRVIEEFAMPDEDYPYTEMTSIKNVVEELEERSDKSVKKIGFVGLDLIPHLTFQRICDALYSEIEVCDAQDICFKLRSIKSPWEIEIIRKGYELTRHVLDKLVKHISPGVTEIEVASEIEGFLRMHGSEGNAVDTIVAFGEKNTHPIVNRPGSTSLKKNDFGLLTFGPRFCGYNPAIGRPFFIGKGNEKIIDIAKIALEAQFECELNLKPGAVGREVEAVGRKVLAKHGLENYFVYAGIHSVGLAEFEPPILGTKSEDIIEPGMVFSIDIPIFLAPWGGLRFEDGFIITSDGNIPLSNFYREIIHL